MATIVTRNIKGSPLSFTELDANFTNLNTAKYEANANPIFGAITATSCTLSGAASVASLAVSEGITTATATTSGLLTAATYRNLSKSVVTTTALTAVTIAAQTTYFTGTTGASFAITLPPAATANLDGMIYTVMSTVARAATTWISTGATFVGTPTALAANTPVRLQFHLATNQWFIC